MPTTNRALKTCLLVGVSALSGACAPARPAAPAAPEPAPVARRAVLVSMDGMSGVRLARLLSEAGKLGTKGLRRLADSGFFAVRSVPCTPSLTPAAHATHITGALPRDTGIVGNVLLDPGKPFGARRNGFDTPLRAETLCEAARRQGKRVGVMAYPHGEGTPPTGCAGFGMRWVSVSMARPRVTRPGAGFVAAGSRAGWAPVSAGPLRFSRLPADGAPGRDHGGGFDRRRKDELRRDPRRAGSRTAGAGPRRRVLPRRGPRQEGP